MEQNSSNVCIAATHRDDQKSTRLPDDAMPVYATIIPANTRKARLQRQQQEQAAMQTTSAAQKKQLVSITSKVTTSDNEKICTAGVKQTDNDNVIGHNSNNNNYDSTSGESDDDDSVELWSNEIPVYIKGEQRWISGVTEQTTCLDIIEALLIDEGIIKASEDINNNITTNGVNSYPSKVNEYVITERWRRMEQALDGRTKILKIWSSWGTEQSEVRFSLKRRSDSHNSSTHQQSSSQQQQSQTHTIGGVGDRDSGRGSPTGSINSAIVRRRRHRASRSTFAWMTHGQTIHPKSSKNNIERLMKLILEQGEVIQQQLAKLRDRELEISTLEEERHKVREKEHGKNYLLETYLKGLPDSDDKQELTAGNSDSGVHTEETAASPEVQHEDETSDTLIPLNHYEPNINSPAKVTSSSKKSSHHHRRSKREHELLREHQSTKEYSSAISSGSTKQATNEGPINSEVAAQIDILEKLIVLNKHLQREEELCVRLSAKIKRYEADASGLTEAQVKESLKRVEEQLNAKNCEIAQMESEIKSSDEALSSKTDVLKKLYDELEEAEVEHRKLEMNNNDTVDGAATSSISSIPIPPALPPLKLLEQHKLLTQQPNHDELGMSREYLAENIYNISKLILKSSGQTIPMNVNSASYQQQQQAMSMAANQNFGVASAEKRVIQAQIHSIPTSVQQQQCRNHNEAMRASMNYLATINQRLQKSNNQYIESDINNANNNPIIQATQYKLTPKKLLINTQACGSRNSNNNNNIFKRNIILQPNDLTTQQDVSQLGTLV